MTRKEAIEYLKSEYEDARCDDDKYIQEWAEALDMAIKVLEQEPSEEYRRGWMDAITTALKETTNYYTEDGVFKAIQEETLIGVGMLMEKEQSE